MNFPVGSLLDSAERNATFLRRVTLPAALLTQSTMVLPVYLFESIP